MPHREIHHRSRDSRSQILIATKHLMARRTRLRLRMSTHARPATTLRGRTRCARVQGVGADVPCSALAVLRHGCRSAAFRVAGFVQGCAPGEVEQLGGLCRNRENRAISSSPAMSCQGGKGRDITGAGTASTLPGVICNEPLPLLFGNGSKHPKTRIGSIAAARDDSKPSVNLRFNRVAESTNPSNPILKLSSIVPFSKAAGCRRRELQCTSVLCGAASLAAFGATALRTVRAAMARVKAVARLRIAQA